MDFSGQGPKWISGNFVDWAVVSPPISGPWIYETLAQSTEFDGTLLIWIDTVQSQWECSISYNLTSHWLSAGIHSSQKFNHLIPHIFLLLVELAHLRIYEDGLSSKRFPVGLLFILSFAVGYQMLNGNFIQGLLYCVQSSFNTLNHNL